MMETGSNYYTAWVIYLLAVLAAQILLWRLVKRLNSINIRWLLHLCLLALLITPVSMDNAQHYWVPAMMAALMDGLNIGLDAAIPRLIPMFMVLLVLVVLSVIFRLVINGITKPSKNVR